jgi:hypothetical protein
MTPYDMCIIIERTESLGLKLVEKQHSTSCGGHLDLCLQMVEIHN